jgi:predicted nuclease of predicted toxin-antitoxin system
MRLLLDQGTPRSTAALLRTAGFDAVHTAEIGLAEAEDEEILRKAASEDRVVVTLDADFHTLLALSQASKPSVVRIRIEGLRAKKLSQLLERVIMQCLSDLENGAMISVQENRIRVRRLPVAAK